MILSTNSTQTLLMTSAIVSDITISCKMCKICLVLTWWRKVRPRCRHVVRWGRATKSHGSSHGRTPRGRTLTVARGRTMHHHWSTREWRRWPTVRRRQRRWSRVNRWWWSSMIAWWTTERGWWGTTRHRHASRRRGTRGRWTRRGRSTGNR